MIIVLWSGKRNLFHRNLGTERSVRHMFYVVADELVRVYGAENSIKAGYKWRSRREVIDWLTSMLSKQHFLGDGSKSPKHDSAQALGSPECPMNGVSAGKIQSFVFVKSKGENHYVAYLEDMYKDKRGQKKVRVRWFHHYQEVKGVVSLRNPHLKEIFITPHSQVISAECVDSPATVLTHEHFEKCLAAFPNAFLARIQMCTRQFRCNRFKPFDLNILHGYYDQPILSFLNSSTLQEIDSFGHGLNRDTDEQTAVEFAPPKAY